MTLTLDQLKHFVERLVVLQAGQEPYTIDWLDMVAKTKYTSWKIIIPDEILSDIRLEEE